MPQVCEYLNSFWIHKLAYTAAAGDTFKEEVQPISFSNESASGCNCFSGLLDCFINCIICLPVSTSSNSSSSGNSSNKSLIFTVDSAVDSQEAHNNSDTGEAQEDFRYGYNSNIIPNAHSKVEAINKQRMLYNLL